MVSKKHKAPTAGMRLAGLLALAAGLALAAAWLIQPAPAQAGEKAPGVMLAKDQYRLHSDPAGPTGRPDKGKGSDKPYYKKGPKVDSKWVPKLPPGNVPAPWYKERGGKERYGDRWGKEKYYYHHGHFFRPYDRGFIYVAPPPGVVVPFLPPGFTTMIIAGSQYYYYQGNYYSRVPTGYLVVAPPAASPFVPAPLPPPMPDPGPAPMPAPSFSPYGAVTITAPSLNVRTGPGREYNVVTVITQGGIYAVQATSPNWVYIQLPDGQFGWVERIYTAPASTPTPSG